MLKNMLISLLLILIMYPTSCCSADDPYQSAREKLVAVIEENVTATRAYIDRKTLNPKVLQAIGNIPRHKFVPPGQEKHAYQNRPLAIGHGQTISQPYIVALMTDLLELTPDSKVLEIGTGSGYQAAVLNDLAAVVYSIEIIEPLAKEVAHRLDEQGYTDVHTKSGDGYYGWPEAGPFDAIIVTAAADHVPPPLLQQLKIMGRMVIPVGSRFQTQQLLLIVKESESSISTRQILPVVFVPLTGEH